MRGGPCDRLEVERLDPTQVDHTRIDAVLGEQIGCALGHANHPPGSQDRTVASASPHLCASRLETDRYVRNSHADSLAARVAQRHRTLERERGPQHVHELSPVSYTHLRAHE